MTASESSRRQTFTLVSHRSLPLSGFFILLVAFCRLLSDVERSEFAVMLPGALAVSMM